MQARLEELNAIWLIGRAGDLEKKYNLFVAYTQKTDPAATVGTFKLREIKLDSEIRWEKFQGWDIFFT